MKLLNNLFNKYMRAEKEANKLCDSKLLNRKRAKSKKKQKNDNNDINIKENIETFNQKNIIIEKNIDSSLKNIRHFLHFDWDDLHYEKESIQISKYITSSLYWYLINSSYFAEDCYENNVRNITERYLETASINNNQNETKNIENNCINKSNNNNNKIDDIDTLGIINYINYLYLDKKGKFFPNVLGYDLARSRIAKIKSHLFYYINFLNIMNKGKINQILQKSKEINCEDKNKNYDNDTIDLNNNSYEYKLKDNYSYQKSEISYNIRNKFWNYLYKKEKEFLIQREEKNIQDKEFCINSCNVCNIEDLDIYNHLYECVQCGIKVHPLCYRMKTDPDPKKWKCSVCKIHSNNVPNNLDCLLCPVKGGAMQRTKILKEGSFYKTLMKFRNKDDNNDMDQEYINISSTPHQDSPWVHLTCALWNSDVKIDIYDKKKGIKFDEPNIIHKYKSLCYICKSSNYGPTIRCKIRGCDISCHPECARTNDYYFEIETVDKAMTFNYYCHKHRPNRFIKYINKTTNTSNEEIFAFSNALNYVYQLFKKINGYDFYPTKINGQEVVSIELDELNESENLIKKIRGRSRYKNKIKINKNFIKKSKRLSPIPTQKIVIDLKNNISTQEKINNNIAEENNIINNCVSNIKINCNENDKLNSFNQININLTNETNNSIKSNISQNYSNSSENNKLSTKIESHSSILEEQKEEFAINLVKHLRTYFDKNRIFVVKGNGNYCQSSNEEKEESITLLLDDFNYEDLESGKYNIDKMKYKKELNKRYEEIYKDKEDFDNYFKKNIEMNFTNKENIVQENIEIKNEASKSKKRVGKSKKKYF